MPDQVGESLIYILTLIPASGSFCWSAQVVIALEETTVKNGCTMVVPGSHLTGKYTDREFDNAKPLELNIGDIAIWDSRLWHGTYRNQTSQTRWALVATFSAWWVKPSMDFTRSLPQEIYEKLNAQEKSLLGLQYSSKRRIQRHQYQKEP